MINDNEMNNLSSQLLNSGILKRGGICLLLAASIGIASKTSSKINLLIFQIPIIFFQLLAINPLFGLIDINRQLPLREASKFMINSRKSNESIAMVGIKKPSVHFYTKMLPKASRNYKKRRPGSRSSWRPPKAPPGSKKCKKTRCNTGSCPREKSE